MGKSTSKPRLWSAEVAKRSNALDLEPGVFTWKDPRKIAESLKRSAEESTRQKGTPLQSTMSMLNFYINRAGKNLDASQKEVLKRAKDELRKLSAPERKPIDTCADYLLKYRDMLHYDNYLAQGLPIATGVIEGACRHLVKDRLDITGARWRLDSAEAVLKLHSLHSSGDGDAYWDFHKAQELRRNHSSRIIGNRPLQKAA